MRPHIALVRFVHRAAHASSESIGTDNLGGSFRYVAVIHYDRSELRSHIVMAFRGSFVFHILTCPKLTGEKFLRSVFNRRKVPPVGV
jgi:hypothetical protein